MLASEEQTFGEKNIKGKARKKEKIDVSSGPHITVVCEGHTYGEFHPGRELTAIELENFWFAVKPISMWIYFKDFCTFVYVSIFLGKRSSSIWFTILLVELVSNGL